MDRALGTTPDVSVVIPFYNRADTIRRAIESVRCQTVRNIEIILVDDASIDDAAASMADLLSDERLRLVRHAKNRGVSAARNTGVAMARGRYVAFLDSDDFWYPTKLERQLEAIGRSDRPTCTLCVTQTEIVMPGGWTRIRPLRPPPPGQAFGEYLYKDGGFAQASSFLLARDLAARIPFREGLRQYEDHLFFIELGATGVSYLLVPEPLSVWFNDSRPDRLSSTESRDRAEQFLDTAGTLISENVRLAFHARALGEFTWRESPRAAVALFARTAARGALPPLVAASLLARAALPQRLYERIRRTLTRSRGQPAADDRLEPGAAS